MDRTVAGRARLGGGIALVALAAVTRLPSLLHPAAIDDEAIYAVVANAMIDGGLPYESAIERKPPLLFWTYAAVFQLAGKFNWPALHLVALVWVLLTMAGLYVIGRRLFGRRAGLIAALLYCIYQPWGTWKNLAFNGEVLMNLPLVWAYAIGFGPAVRRTRPLFGAGMLLGAACLLKQPAAIAAIPLGVYVLLPAYRAARSCTWRDSLIHAVCLTAGFAAALGAAAAVLWSQGILSEALYWTIGDHDVPHVFWRRALEHTGGFVAAALPLLLPVFGWPLQREAWNPRRSEWLAVLGWAGVSVVGAAASGRFYPHYYIQLIPPLAVLAAAVYARVWDEPSIRTPWYLRRRIARGWLAATVVVFSSLHWTGLAVRREPSEAGRYLLRHSSAEDRIFVWGQGPRVYLEARRPQASRYVATFPLTGNIFGGPVAGVDTTARIVPGAWSTLKADLEAHPPAFIVDIEVREDSRYPMARFPYLAGLVAEHYQQVATVEGAVIYQRCAAVRRDAPARAASDRPWGRPCGVRRPDISALVPG
jgi:4-amino-4-deoxy-L-arabinose transferase-like glycosyltransferase